LEQNNALTENSPRLDWCNVKQIILSVSQQKKKILLWFCSFRTRRSRIIKEFIRKQHFMAQKYSFEVVCTAREAIHAGRSCDSAMSRRWLLWVILNLQVSRDIWETKNKFKRKFYRKSLAKNITNYMWSVNIYKKRNIYFCNHSFNIFTLIFVKIINTKSSDIARQF